VHFIFVLPLSVVVTY